LQKSTNDAKVQRNAIPMANGRVDGDQAHGELRKGQTGGSTASTTGTAVAKPQSRERPEPGVRKDVAGQRFSSDGRHLRSFIGTFVHAGVSRAV